MKVGRRGFFASLFAAPIAAKVLAETESEPKPLPVLKCPAMPRDDLYSHSGGMSTTLCVVGRGDYMPDYWVTPNQAKRNPWE